MKLCRIGDLDKEKPAIIDKDNKYRDLSSIIDDFNPETLNFENIKKIKEANKNMKNLFYKLIIKT